VPVRGYPSPLGDGQPLVETSFMSDG